MRRAHFGPAEVAIAAALVVSIQFVAALLGPPEGVLALLAAVCTSVSLPAVLFVALAVARGPEVRAEVGLVGPGSGRAVAVGVSWLVAALPGVLLLSACWGVVLDGLGVEAEPAYLPAVAELGAARLAVAAVLALVVGPLAEELLFRGLLQPVLVRSLGPDLGVLGTSFLFAAIHATAARVPVFALSLVLGWAMLRTGRIAAPMAMHVLYNAAALAITLAAGGTT